MHHTSMDTRRRLTQPWLVLLCLVLLGGCAGTTARLNERGVEVNGSEVKKVYRF